MRSALQNTVVLRVSIKQRFRSSAQLTDKIAAIIQKPVTGKVSNVIRESKRSWRRDRTLERRCRLCVYASGSSGLLSTDIHTLLVTILFHFKK